jgi:sugar phosphate isomerase/epimerase
MSVFSLAHLTVLHRPPPAMIELAARTGFDAVGLRLIAVTPTTPGYDLMADHAMLRATKAAMAATGVRVGDIEFVKITPDIDVRAHEAFMATGAELGAKHMIVAPYDPDLSRLSERLAALCDLAAPYGLSVELEFFPWTNVPDLAAADRVVATANRPNAGVLVDALHFSRSASTLDQLQAMPASRLPMLHLCDAAGPTPTTHDGLIFTARGDRLPPGEGEIELVALLRAMPAGVTIGVEVPMRNARVEDDHEIAQRCLDGARRVVAAAR